MLQQRLYYDFVDGQLVPYWYVLGFQQCEINWDAPAYYYDAIKPFKFVERDEFDESLISVSIFFSDLIFNVDDQDRIGINLRAIKKRIERYQFDHTLIQQFVMSIPDVNDLLVYLPKQRKMEFVLI